ncbi:uncharacterized protein K489DRAFT_356658 [Dissoconium aciculare CBS 342.82]|uniref:Mitochondrial import inner membrane translocase subunit n=1 Tax=Dissoconium aciculare CBS 342.82 TaxID=1314786 RepID=A0A6J3M765_9PEZI|nr:uncharacterized protein K489DRAFT_356658 [Dissoconium aciculare CBS 342.82]KAF1822697.1 hypothetical protein K489DRAFT_356658 [Dissoconium aciculare CBS 342.82]
MDNANISPELLQGLQNLPDKDKLELSQFVAAETQKAQIQSTVHHLTDICFRKCITGRISGSQLDSSENSCMQNCVGRFMDANMLVVRNLQRQQGSH